MVKRPAHLLLLLPFLLLHLPSAMAAPGQQVEFSAAWERLLAASDTLAAAESGLEQARGKRQAAGDPYLPEIEASANYLHLDDEVTLSPNDLLASTAGGDRLAPMLDGLARSSGLSAAYLDSLLTATVAEQRQRSVAVHGNWPLYAGGRIDAMQKIAGAAEKEARIGVEATRREQFITLATYYFATALADQSLDIRKRSEQSLETHFDHALRLEKEGQIARVERLRAEAARDKAVVERRKAERDLEIAAIALGRLLKSDTPLYAAESPAINRTLPPLPDLLTATVDGGPQLATLAAREEQATGLAAVEKGRYLPSIALVGSYNIYEEDDLTGKLMPDWLVGIGLKMPLLDRSGRGGNLAAAESLVRRIGHLREQTASDLTVLVEKTHRLAAQAKEEYHGLESSLRLAEETVALRHKAFAQGLGTSLDVVDAELFLAGVRLQRSLAAHAYVTNLARLLAGAGQIDLYLSSSEQHEAR